MKKILSLLIALALICGSMLIFASCGGDSGDNGPKSEIKAEDVNRGSITEAPSGYEKYQNEYCSFVYPSDSSRWGKSFDYAQGMFMVIDLSNNNNISIYISDGAPYVDTEEKVEASEGVYTSTEDEKNVIYVTSYDQSLDLGCVAKVTYTEGTDVSYFINIINSIQLYDPD
ncbi:MAG: hypothetical protein IJW54_07470 [Clostridia bacterium]|nr:hypothetical protein [Clostridia bacterium]